MNAEELDYLLKELIQPTGLVLSSFNEWQSTPSVSASIVKASLKKLIQKTAFISKQAAGKEHDCFIGYQENLAVFLLTDFKIQDLSVIRDEFKEFGLDFLGRLSGANKYISEKENFCILERMLS